ncbi:MAG: DUF5615 family PIN-like protein [Phycisphaerales bacterium]|nr:DUF5615 family PIN-like protein [Phycisphaerales bacterium]
MRFLVDNSLSPRMAEELIRAGHEAVHVRDLNMASADDDDIFDMAQDKKCILLSEDTDFGTLLATRHTMRPSVVLFRCQRKSVEALVPLLLKNLDAISPDLESGAIAVFQDERLRVRRLPLAVGS